MKKFSTHILNESINPGNALLKTGVMNHYTPVQNILTNVRNLFCHLLGVVAEIGEDELSIKLSSSQFTSQQKMNEILWRPMYNDVFTYGTSSLQGYITSQGLPKVTSINLGGYYVVYFSPDDIRAAKDPISMEPDAVCAKVDGCDCGCDCDCDCCCPCPCEANESLYDEFEMARITEDDDDDSNNLDNTNSDDSDMDDINIVNIINNSDKIIAAKQLNILVSEKMQLPREYYFTSVKFKNGDESIALRWKYNKQLPTGKVTENTHSLIHIFGGGVNGVWVQDFDKDSIVQLPESVKNIVNQVLEILGAQETDNPAIFNINGLSVINKEMNNEDTDNEEDKDDNESDDKKADKDNDKNTEELSL